MRIYDSRLGRFLSLDPLTKEYPWYTPYQFAGNMPLRYIDLDGLEPATPPCVVCTGSEGLSTAPLQNSNSSDLYLWEYDSDNKVFKNMGATTKAIDIVAIRDRSFGEIVRGLESNLKGDKGLKNYGKAIDFTGNRLREISLLTGPAAPVVFGIGEGLNIFAEVIEIGFEFKNDNASDAYKKLAIRVGSYLTGKGLTKTVNKGFSEEKNVVKNGTKLVIDKTFDESKDAALELINESDKEEEQ